jgi:starch synthase
MLLERYQNTKIKTGHLARVVVLVTTQSLKENDFDCVHWGTVKLGRFNFSFNVLKETTDKLGI